MPTKIMHQSKKSYLFLWLWKPIYIYGLKVTVYSVRKSLQYTFKKPLVSAPPRIQCLLIRLKKYQLDIMHVPGKHLNIADTLSKAHLPRANHDNNVSDDSTVMIHTVISNLPISADKLIYHCYHDPKWKLSVIHFLPSLLPTQPRWLQRHYFSHGTSLGHILFNF